MTRRPWRRSQWTSSVDDAIDDILAGRLTGRGVLVPEAT